MFRTSLPRFRARHGAPLRWRSGIAFLLLLGTCAGLLRAQADPYQVKALFLVNFARYIDWPPQTFASPADPINICVLGRNPFGNTLEQAISGKTVDGRTLAVHQVSESESGRNCQILFVSAVERKRFLAVSKSLRELAVLTVGEEPQFTSEGGVISFKVEDGKIRFEINVEAAAQGHLHISSKLLNLAQIVRK